MHFLCLWKFQHFHQTKHILYKFILPDFCRKLNQFYIKTRYIHLASTKIVIETSKATQIAHLARRANLSCYYFSARVITRRVIMNKCACIMSSVVASEESGEQNANINTHGRMRLVEL